MYYLEVPYFNLFHRAVIFYILLFRSFYLIKLLIFIKTIKNQLNCKFSNFYKKIPLPLTELAES